MHTVLGGYVSQCPCTVSYVLEAPVEHLELSFTEVSLSFELVKALRPMAHHGHLKVIICFI